MSGWTSIWQCCRTKKRLLLWLRKKLKRKSIWTRFCLNVEIFCVRRAIPVDQEKVKQIEEYYKKCAEAGATADDIEASKKAMSSMEIILGEPSRLERLAEDIHDHYVSSCEKDPGRVQKAMVVCSSRTIAYELLKKFQEKYPEWFVEKKVPDGVVVSDEELRELKPMPFMAMVASVGSNDRQDMYN